jgi:hypothetical protein
MPELVHTAEHHCDAGFVGGCDHVLVVKRAARDVSPLAAHAWQQHTDRIDGLAEREQEPNFTQ